MALRSLPGKLKGFLRARAATAASEEPLKFMGSRARPRAIMKQNRGRKSLRDEELIRGIRTAYRIVGAVGVAVIGMMAFSVASTVKAVDERRRKHMEFEEVYARIMDEARSKRGDHRNWKY